MSHLPYREWCPECVEAFSRERARLSSSTEAREFPPVSVDFSFLSDKGVLPKAESKNKWHDPQRVRFECSQAPTARLNLSCARGFAEGLLTAEVTPPVVLLTVLHGLVTRW